MAAKIYFVIGGGGGDEVFLGCEVVGGVEVVGMVVGEG